MILLWFIVILLAGGVAAWMAARWSASAARWVALGAVSLDFALAVWLWAVSLGQFEVFRRAVWIEELDLPWIPQLGIHFHLALDGLSLLMVVLTLFLGILSVLASWSEITEGVGFFHWNLMWILAGITSVFLAVDLFLFYFAWELMLIPDRKSVV